VEGGGGENGGVGGRRRDKSEKKGKTQWGSFDYARNASTRRTRCVFRALVSGPEIYTGVRERKGRACVATRGRESRKETGLANGIRMAGALARISRGR
jgi:hypothetical protein